MVLILFNARFQTTTQTKHRTTASSNEHWQLHCNYITLKSAVQYDHPIPSADFHHTSVIWPNFHNKHAPYQAWMVNICNPPQNKTHGETLLVTSWCMFNLHFEICTFEASRNSNKSCRCDDSWWLRLLSLVAKNLDHVIYGKPSE